MHFNTLGFELIRAYVGPDSALKTACILWALWSLWPCPLSSCRTPQASGCPKMSLPCPCNKPLMLRECWALSELGTCQEDTGWPGHLLPFRLESSSRKAPGVRRTVPHLQQSKRRAGRGSRLSPLPVGGRVTPATQLLPTLVRCPSQQLCDHTQRPSRALAAIPPGNYTLGANLLPLPGEAWGEDKESKKERRTGCNTGGKAALQTTTRALQRRKNIFLR